MEFQSYPSIENTTHQKTLAYSLEHHPALHTYMYILREKIDGCNIQFLFQPNQPVTVGKRTSFLNEGDNFFDIWSTVERYKSDLDKLQSYCNELNHPIRVYGELYGQGIQKRVNYGPSKYISLFDCYIGEAPLLQTKLEELFISLGLFHLLPPVIGYANNLQEALAFVPIFKSKVYPDAQGDNFAEGVVLQPYGEDVKIRFLLKLKHPRFEEKMPKREPKIPSPQDSKISLLRQEFNEYINENRVLSVFSKHGEIANANQIGEYIKYVLEDAKTDFIKEHDLTEFDKNDIRDIFNVGGKIVNLLKKYT